MPTSEDRMKKEYFQLNEAMLKKQFCVPKSQFIYGTVEEMDHEPPKRDINSIVDDVIKGLT